MRVPVRDPPSFHILTHIFQLSITSRKRASVVQSGGASRPSHTTQEAPLLIKSMFLSPFCQTQHCPIRGHTHTLMEEATHTHTNAQKEELYKHIHMRAHIGSKRTHVDTHTHTVKSPLSGETATSISHLIRKRSTAG